MATTQQNTDQINALTEVVNDIINNSETINQQPLQTPLLPTSQFAIEESGSNFKGNIQQILDLVQNGLTGSVVASHPVLIPFDFSQNNKTDLNSLHGSLLINNSEDGIILNSGTPIVGDGGVSKVLGIVLAGTDLVGSYTITGTSIDRNTGVETPADSEVVNVNGLSIDNSAPDANGNTIYDYSNTYISSKWWKGTLTFSTTDLDLTEIRFAQVSFEQFDDSPNIVVDSLDATYIISNSAAFMDCYMYAVDVVGSICNVTQIAELHHEAGFSPDNSFRRRQGNIDKSIDGLTSGVFVDLYLAPTTQAYFSSFSLKIWATQTQTIDVNFS